MVEGMVFYKEYFDYLDDLTPEQFVELMRMIRDLRYYGKDTPVSNVEDRMVRIAWRAVRPSVAKSTRNAKDYQDRKKKKTKKVKKPVQPKTDTPPMDYKGYLEAKSKELLNNMTVSEKRVARWLDKNDISYVPQQPIMCFPQKGYIADFVLSDYKAIIEVDGETHNSDEAKEMDALRTKHLENRGYKVYRIENKYTQDEFINSKMSEIMGRVKADYEQRQISKKAS